MNTTTMVDGSNRNPSITITAPDDLPSKDNAQKNVSSSNHTVINDDPVKENTPRERYDHMIKLETDIWKSSKSEIK